MATSAKVVIVEVDEIVEAGELDPEEIVTPHLFVNAVVVAEKVLTRESAIMSKPLKHNQQHEIIAERVAKELKGPLVVNLGIGIPTLIPKYLNDDSIIFILKMDYWVLRK